MEGNILLSRIDTYLLSNGFEAHPPPPKKKKKEGKNKENKIINMAYQYIMGTIELRYDM